MQTLPRPGLLSLSSFSVSVCLGLAGIGLPMLGVDSAFLGLVIMTLAATSLTVAAITGIAWALPFVRKERVRPQDDSPPLGTTIEHAEHVHRPTHRHPLQVEEETDEEFLKRQIEKWRAEIRNGNFNGMPLGASQFCATETYIEMKPYLPQRVQNRLQSHHGAVTAWLSSPHMRGTEDDRRVLLGEVARIEKERGVI